jgi:glycosyltransferase involved in cell wall biosynthesis
MRILISSHYLDLSGVPTYTLALVTELRKRRHNVDVYTIEGGKLATQLAPKQIDQLEKPDVIIVQANSCARVLWKFFYTVPMIFSAHGVLPELEQPPTDLPIQRYTAINEDTSHNLMRRGVPASQIEIVRDFVDTERFKPGVPIHAQLRRVLFISNRRKGRTWQIISDATRRLGLDLIAVGAPYRRTEHVEYAINEADLVISTGRGILEGMACGRPVVSFGEEMGDGYLTREVYLDSRTRNFAGEWCRHRLDAEGLVRELEKYNASDGEQNRELVLEHHNVVRGVDQILNIIGRVL